MGMDHVQTNGIRLAYEKRGSGYPLVLVHGNGEDHHLFDTQIRQMSEAGNCVYALDSRGHGESSPVREYHYEQMAEDVFQFVRAMGLKAPAYYGHSDGGIIGLITELRHPETFCAMAVSGANLSPSGLDPAFVRECEAMQKNRPDPLIALMLTEPEIDPEELRHISIPVLVTCGERDLIQREETLSIAAHLRKAELVIVPGADHGSYIYQSELMGNLLLAFLRKHLTV